MSFIRKSKLRQEEQSQRMMIHAYQEIYLSNAQAALGDAFDYAITGCNIPGDDFVKLFCGSSISQRMENGEPSLIAGKSGIEIAIDVVSETTGKHDIAVDCLTDM